MMMRPRQNDGCTYRRYARCILSLGTVVLTLLLVAGVPTGVLMIIFLQIVGLLVVKPAAVVTAFQQTRADTNRFWFLL